MKKLILISIGLFLVGCSVFTKWTGFVYPDGLGYGIDESKWLIQPGFNSLDECRDWALDNLGSNPNADYECGSDCHPGSLPGMHICKETLE